MANTLYTPTWIGREVLQVADNETRFVKNIDKKLGGDFRVAGVKVGETIGIRLPQRFVTNKGQAYQGQAITDQIVYVTITDQAQVGWGWSSIQASMEIQDVQERYVNPAGIQMANTMDKDGLGRLYQDVYQNVGTPGTTPTSNQTYFDGRVKLTNSSVPTDSRNVVLNAIMMSAIANANVTLFNQMANTKGFEEGVYAADALGWKRWWEDVNTFPHVYGTYTGTPLVNGASQTGTSLITDGWTSGGATLNKGDNFTIGSGATGTYSVNPQSYQSTTQLQDFVVTQTISDTTGAMTISISPPIITSGPFQTVVASPANDATINVAGASGVTSVQGLSFHKQAFVMASADLVMPEQGTARIIRKNGISIRLWKASDIMSDQHPSRMDSIYGFKTLRADWAVRING
jgi:hypothetical protein